MKKNIFSVSGLSVMNFCRNKARRRTVAGVMTFALVISLAFPLSAGTALGSAEIIRQSAGVSGDVSTGTFNAGGGVGAIEWARFNVMSGETATFDNGTFFNQVKADGGISQIIGTIDGTANVWLFNPSGIFFDKTSTVNVGGTFAASTANIQNMDELINGTAHLYNF